MILTAIDGFCMALADSVPGVSGGTVAFLMGFYDDFIGSIHDIVFGSAKEKKHGVIYLLKLGLGWIPGMILAILVLNALFTDHIHVISSLFLGLVIGAVPVVILDEKKCLKNWRKGILFLILGFALVVLVTYLSTKQSVISLDLSNFTPGLAIYMILVAMCAIAAMFLPGISGSTMLLIFGAYLPIMTALSGLLKGDFSYAPALLCYLLGAILGAVSVVHLIQESLRKYRVQMICLVLGMMIGSCYAIVMGPTTLDVPQAALSLSNFSPIAFLIGMVLVLGMELAKQKQNKKQESGSVRKEHAMEQ